MAFSVQLQPVALQPPAGQTSEPRPPFVWQPVPDATNYTLAVDTVEGQLVQRQTLHTSQICSGASCSYTRGALLPIGRYVWYVMPSNGGGDGPWSTGLRFDVTPLPAPTPNAPAGYLATRQPTYVWIRVPGAHSYLLLVDDATPAPIVRKHLTAAEVCGASSCAFTPAAVLEPGPHTWYVSAWNDAGEGASAAGDFDGDGRTDRLCSDDGVTNVSLSTDFGSAPAAVWLDRQLGAMIAADFNGDGKADLAEYDGSTASFRVGLSSGGSFAHLVEWGQATASWAGASYSCTRPVLTGIANFDGNGLPDFYCQGGPSSMIFVGKNTGSGFGFSIFADYSCWGVHERSGPADFDGDGRDDWSCIDGHGGVYARLNNGHSFEELSFKGLGGGFCEQAKILFTDLNADGRTDVTCASSGAVALSTGAALLDQGSFGGWCLDAEARLASLDVDGDGVSELVCTHAGGSASDVFLRRWGGSSLSPPMLVQAGWCGGAVLGGDFDGNGRSELRCHDGRVLPGSDGSPPADLMVDATNGLGGRTTVSYVPSSRFPTANNPPVSPLVAALTSADGRGGSSTTTFSYEGAKLDRHESKSLGFARVRVTSPCLAGEAECPYTDTWYSQDRATAGLATRVERRDGAGRLHQATSYTYAAALGPPRRAVLTRLETTDFGPTGDSRTTATTYSHDGFGNITETLALGDVAVPGDEVETDVTMAAPDLTRYIVDRPRLIERREPSGDAVTSEELTYDPLGRPIHMKRLVKPATGSRGFLERSVGYDTTGNPTSITNERGGLTTITYEADGLRLESVTSPANETTVVDWHPKCDAPESTTDANGQVTTNEYDALCRPTKTLLPPDAQGQQAFTLRHYLDFGDPSTQRVRVEAPGTNGNHFALTYFDGFGRGYRSVERGPTSGQEIVTTRAWNGRGGLAAGSAPFYEGEDADLTTYTYDAFDRLVNVRHPDTSQSGKTYGCGARPRPTPTAARRR